MLVVDEQSNLPSGCGHGLLHKYACRLRQLGEARHLKPDMLVFFVEQIDELHRMAADAFKDDALMELWLLRT